MPDSSGPGESPAPGHPLPGPAGGRAAGDDGDLVAAFINRVESRFKRHDARLDEHHNLLARLAKLYDGKNRASGSDDEAPPVPVWLVAEQPGEATAELVELAQWLDDVYLRWPDAELPECWAWHPDAVYELSILRLRWMDAHYGPKRSAALVGDWLDKARPNLVGRLKSIEHCNLDHHAQNGRLRRPRTAALRSALPLIAGIWTVSRDLPIPTDEHLEEAARHARAALDLNHLSDPL